MRRKIASVLLGAIVASLPAVASELQIHLPPESTTIDFTLKATMHTVHGTASLDHADFTIDTETGEASGEAVVASASADTENTKRDKKMHTKVLLSDAHPRIVFKARSIEGDLNPAGTSEINLTGIIEIIGVEHPVNVPIRVTMADGAVEAEASFSVPYVEWGLKDPSTFVLRVGKAVPVTVRAAGITVTPPVSP